LYVILEFWYSPLQFVLLALFLVIYIYILVLVGFLPPPFFERKKKEKKNELLATRYWIKKIEMKASVIIRNLQNWA